MHIASIPRRDGETAFPEYAAILEAVRGVIRSQRAPESSSGERWNSYAEEFWKQPPVPLDAELQAKINALNEKFSLKKPKEIVTVNSDLVCPRCHFAQAVSANFRNWTAAEILEYGAVVQGLELIAERNRNMPELPLGEIVDEVTA